MEKNLRLPRVTTTNSIKICPVNAKKALNTFKKNYSDQNLRISLNKNQEVLELPPISPGRVKKLSSTFSSKITTARFHPENHKLAEMTEEIEKMIQDCESKNSKETQVLLSEIKRSENELKKVVQQIQYYNKIKPKKTQKKKSEREPQYTKAEVKRLIDDLRRFAKKIKV